MAEKDQIVPLYQTAQLEAVGAGSWSIDNLLRDDVDISLVGINTDLIKRWKGYLLGLDSLAIETGPESAFQGPEAQMNILGRDLGTTDTLGSVKYSSSERRLPSTYRRPHGKILINEVAFGKNYEKNRGSNATETFARQLDRKVRSGLLDIVNARYGNPDSLRPQERSAGFSPYIGSVLATLVGMEWWAADGIGLALYGIALGADYHDARQVLGKNASPSAFKLKRWSLTPCGLPMERHAEILIRSTALLRANPAPKIVKYLQLR